MTANGSNTPSIPWHKINNKSRVVQWKVGNEIEKSFQDELNFYISMIFTTCLKPYSFKVSPKPRISLARTIQKESEVFMCLAV